MKLTVGAKIGMGFTLVSGILLVVGAISYHSTGKLTDTADWVTHTYRVLGALDGMVQALTDAETGQRGFIVTGKEEYLQPYRSGIAIVNQDVTDARNLTRDNPHQQRRLDVLEPLVQQQLGLLKEGIDTEQGKGHDAAQQWVLSGKGKEEMDSIRALAGEMKDEENALLKIRTDEAKTTC